MSHNDSLHVAIIGAGITGVNLALGLQARNIRFTIYERAPGFREIGAGIGFSPNAEVAMSLLDPSVLAAYKRVANPNGEDYFQWMHGFASDELLFKLHVGKDGFQGCRRQDILEEWAKGIPVSAVHFNKAIDTISPPPNSNNSNNSNNTDQLVLRFKDGTTALADAVIGADGIRSRVRQLLGLPPAAYTRKFCFRALAPMAAAVAALGARKASTRFMYVGPGAHAITYPIGGNAVLNILVVVSDPAGAWPDGKRHTAPGSRAEAEAAFGEWQDTVRRIVGLLPGEMDKWAVFDMAAEPAGGYVCGRVAVAGDAAHAMGPHLGAGAGMGIEDALVLAEVMGAVQKKLGESGGGAKGPLVEAALAAYNELRYGRTQDVVQSTRGACDLFHWVDPELSGNSESFGRDITARFNKIWEYDLEGVVKAALAQLDAATA
ncbi:FAD/NAD(P)-binding domain-containing protein [Trichocladium antarcticum]|uniref:FAD/NAD(P)-binding domain-containing protein n=1 Tax=Trichocladium antarcticum TaxID=1450529 RepID=A0AAN6UC51_9PEZI|nr:FAD/NAD(P)-binding domain-containing protein [Trichocladium antarcticum]